MRVISGLVPLRAAMTLEGVSVGGLPAHRMVERRASRVPENRRLFPRLTVEDNLRIGAFIPQARHRLHKLTRVRELFPRLRDRRDQLGRARGGEQQMRSAAR
jgi:branched-chain amino acid transport system ATP-binding protein